MKKINILFAFVLGLGALVSCSQEDEVVVLATKHESAQHSERAKVTPNQVLSIDVEGMTCVHGCGGSIRKAMYETNGVDKVEFDFDENRSVDYAKIYFDSTVTSVAEMTDILNDLNGNQFTISNVETSIYLTDAKITEEDNETDSEDATVEISSSSFEMPNLIDIISSFLI